MKQSTVAVFKSIIENRCNLNKKPYKDCNGNSRVRPSTLCCQRKSQGCTLGNQPIGKLLKVSDA